MHPSNNKSLVVPIILFFITCVIVISGLFQAPQADLDNNYIMDKIFYYTINCLFWISGAYLLNVVIRKLIWGKVFESTAGAKTVGWIEDFTTSVIYLFAAGIIAGVVFDQQLTVSWIIAFIVLLFFLTLLRPKLLKNFSNSFISTIRPFKVGDWIKLIHKNGNNSVIGEVLSFDRMAIQLRSENDTLLLFSNSLLDEFLIENYKGIQKEIIQSILIELSSLVAIEKAKRILAAGTKQALLESGNLQECSPQVLINEIKKNTIEYKINFKFTPWEFISPEAAKDKVLSRIIEHLEISGVGLDKKDNELDIFEKVELFDLLERNEIEQLYRNASKKYFKEGSILIQQGDKGDSMFVLAEGLLNVFIKPEGKETDIMKVGLLTPGQFFGEMSLFTGEDRSATVIAETDVLVYEIKKETVKCIFGDNPDLVEKIGSIIAERQGSNMQKLEEYKNRKDSFIERIVGKIKSYFEL